MKGGSKNMLPRTGKWYTRLLHSRDATFTSNQSGFTIIEVMIVLAVSGAMVISAFVLISGRQAKTEFQQSIQEIKSQLQQTISEVSTGYYPNLNNFKCTASGSNGIIIAAGANQQGTNQDCTFLGKVIQFTTANANGNQQYTAYAIAGRRADIDGNDFTDIAQVSPTTIAPSTSLPNIPDDSLSRGMLYGLTIKTSQGMYYTSSSTKHYIGAVGFISSLGSQNSTGTGLASGSQTVRLVPISNSSIVGVGSKKAAVETINTNLASSTNTLANPDGGVSICFISATTPQSGLITIGGNGRALSVTLSIRGNKTCL